MTIEQRRVGNLPAARTGMVGRRTELAEIRRLFAGAARLVTLTGVGGVGKTRLALEAAAELQPAFRDGVWLVELSPLGQGALLAHTIAEALPLADQTTRPMVDVLADYLAERELLLVLDTCEHLTDACALTVQELMRAAPGLRILATSRRPLDAADEEVFTVEPLPVPETDDPASAQADAVVLLAERAAQSVPGFAVSDASRAELVRLSRRLDGLPLAIELAAARLGEMSVGELTDRLDDRFTVLGETDEVVAGTEPPWHQALRTAIGWSHQLCSPAERLLWARLSVFAGTFDAEAARQVCTDARLAAEHIPGLLADLVDTSILIWQPTGGGERYRMLDTLREYGAGWLRGLGEEDELYRRHRDYYQVLAHRADTAWMGPDQTAWHERTVTEHANLRAALDLCLAEEDGHAALKLSGELWFLWFACGFSKEGRHYLDRALALAPAAGPAHAKALWASGLIAIVQGDAETLGRVAGTFRTAATGETDESAPAAAAYLEGANFTMNGQMTRTAEVLDAAPRSLPASGRYQAGWFLARTIRAFAHVHLGQFADAAAVADDLRAECARHGETWAHAWGHYMRALAALGLGRTDEAADHARTALDGKRRLHDSLGIALVVDLLASVAVASGHAERAAWLLGSAEQIWYTLGVPQVGQPELVAARKKCEAQARRLIGNDAYQTAFDAGHHTALDTCIAYALSSSGVPPQPPSPTPAN
ncbi:AAA family ATPase [Streptomyces sp. NPDC042319]|uniref:ATP-binding protein n=1 Tax=Streptomyces sp. NPDC042319 TaxID=3154332 RepID=UPI0033E96ED8